MTKVTVDYDDLETIVFATAAIKAIEGALAARKSDPFVRPHLDFTAAHDRLASAMRNAKRSESNDTVIKFSDPLSDDEMDMLKIIGSICDDYSYMTLEGKDRAPKHGQVMSVYDQLAAKGCVEIGQLLSGIIWAGAAVPEPSKGPTYAVRLTARGREKLS